MNKLEFKISMNKAIAVLLFLIIGLGNVWAENPNPEAAQQRVEETSQRMIEALRKKREALEQNPGLIYDLVKDIVLPHFDFETMSRWVLGKYWRQAIPEQQRRFVEEFRTLLVNTYANSLLEYSNEKIQFPPMHAAPGSEDVTVPTEIVPKGGQPISINYSMHYTEDGWKVYDVTIDGVSLVTNYRSTFASQIRKEGIDALIQKLSERNQQGQA